MKDFSSMVVRVVRQQDENDDEPRIEFLEIVRVGDSIEVTTLTSNDTDKNGFEPPDHIEHITDWGDAMPVRIGQIVTQFLVEL